MNPTSKVLLPIYSIINYCEYIAYTLYIYYIYIFLWKWSLNCTKAKRPVYFQSKSEAKYNVK